MLCRVKNITAHGRVRYRIATSFNRASEPSGLCINRRSCRKWIRCDPPSTKYNTVRTICLILCITVTPQERRSVSNRSQLNYIYSTARSGWKRRKHKGFEVLLAFCDRWIPIKVANNTERVSFSWWPWWRHQMETFSVLLALCAGNSPFTGEFPAQRPVTRSFDIFFHLCLNKRLSKLRLVIWEAVVLIMTSL